MPNTKQLYDYFDPNLEVDSNTTYPYRQINKLSSKRNINKINSAYIHPSGEYVNASSIQEGLVYQKAFGGVCLSMIDRQNLKHNPDNLDGDYKDVIAIAFMDDGFAYLSRDEIQDRFSFRIAYSGVMSRTYRFINCAESVKDPRINGDLVQAKRKNISEAYKHFASLPKTTLNVSDLRTPITSRKHMDLYEEQEKVLQELQSQDDGFHLLSGEVGVGKTHIAAKYINDYIEKNPNANVLIIEPIDGVVDRFKELIDCQVSYDYDLHRNGGVVISDKTSLLNKANWDLVVFDEFHKMDKDKAVSRYPLDVANMAKNTLAMTGTVSNTYPEQIWSTAKNYVARYARDTGLSEKDALILSPYNDAGLPQMTAIRPIPEFFLDHILGDKSVTLLRQDIKELGLEKNMPVNKFSAGIELTSEDKLFYNFMKMRADLLGMTQADQLRILDMAFNTNQKEFIVQPTQVYGKSEKSFRLVDPETVDTTNHDLLYLGRHDQLFVDKKIDFIAKLHADKNEKILVYLTNDDYAQRVVDDLNSTGVTAEFVDTHMKGAVSKINNSSADVVVFDINMIKEGVDLEANNVVWYSTPESAGLDEQACGRITRLHSEKTEKNFYYLYHKTTIQQELTNNIIRTNDINNIALKRDGVKTSEFVL